MMQRVRTHLAMLRRRGLITEWVDRDIEAGDEWREEIARELEAADLVLLLVSADFLDSDFCYEEEMTRALQRSANGAARVIAVLLRPVDGWEDSPFAHLQVTPGDARPVSTWEDRDEALADVASRIRRVVERIRDEQTPAAAPPPVSSDARLAALDDALTSALDQLLAAGDGQFLIAEIGPYYAQFRAEDGGLWCEVVANEFLEGPATLDDTQLAQLAELGWSEPEENLPNWWWSAPRDLASREIAAFVVRTLAEAYRVEPTGQFVFFTSD